MLFSGVDQGLTTFFKNCTPFKKINILSTHTTKYVPYSYSKLCLTLITYLSLGNKACGFDRRVACRVAPKEFQVYVPQIENP